MAEVHVHPRYQITSARLDQLREHGVIQNENATEGLDLSEPVIGMETVIGALTVEEQVLYREIFEMTKQNEQLSRVGYAQRWTALADRILNDSGFDIAEGGNLVSVPDLTTEQSKMLARNGAKIKMLKYWLWFMMGERFNAHHLTMGIRSGFRVVVPIQGNQPPIPKQGEPA